jgi:hypothetical protein
MLDLPPADVVDWRLGIGLILESRASEADRCS